MLRLPLSYHLALDIPGDGFLKYFIISESLLWSAWNFIAPIFAVFATNHISGGSIQVAATAVSVFLVMRVITELLGPKFTTRLTESQKIWLSISSIILISLTYLGFVLVNTVLAVYFFWALFGLALGISTPTKLSIFSKHLDKNKETSEWGLYDAVIFAFMAGATAIGGYIAETYGFPLLFVAASILNISATIPFLIYLKHQPNSKYEVSHNHNN